MASEASVLSVAVMTLRQFEREAARKLDEMKVTQNLESENTKKQVVYKQPKETEKHKNQHPVRFSKSKTLLWKFLLLCHLTCICSRSQSLIEGWWMSTQELTQQLDKTPLLRGNLDKTLQRGAVLQVHKSNYLQMVRNVLTLHASDAFF